MRIGRTLSPAAAPIYPRDIISGIKALFKGQRELDHFESELKEYFGIKHCFLVSSGKAALTIILQALKDLNPDRDEILIPAFTCYSVPSAIVRAGLKIKLCDIDPDTLDFDFEQLSKMLSFSSSLRESQPETCNPQLATPDPQPALSSEAVLKRSGPSALKNMVLPQAKRSSSLPREMQKLFHWGEAVLQPSAVFNRLLALIPTHLFGLPADIERLRELVDDPGVLIVEDAAQTMGAEWNGKKLGTLGDVAFFSLGRGKALSTVEGGIILTNRGDIAERIRYRIRAIPGYNVIHLIALLVKS
ncbi:MAG: DegT/DnrJ/EryC1/StrS family aminotransferase, partial [Desulfobacteraceae bacterium]